MGGWGALWTIQISGRRWVEEKGGLSSLRSGANGR